MSADMQLVPTLGTKVVVAVPILSTFLFTLVMREALVRAEPGASHWQWSLTLNALCRWVSLGGIHGKPPGKEGDNDAHFDSSSKRKK